MVLVSARTSPLCSRPPRDQVLLSGFEWNPLPLDDQGIAALNNDHIFVVVVRVRCGDRSFRATPKRHLAPVCPIEYVTLDSWGRLIGLRNSVSWMFHELGKVVHGCELVSHSSRQLATLPSSAVKIRHR